MTPSSSVAGSETPRNDTLPGVNTSSEDVKTNMNLTSFQARYTSEDNESFNKIVDKQNRKRAERYTWMWNNNKIPSTRQIAQSVYNQQRAIADSGRTDSGHASSISLTRQNGRGSEVNQSQALVPRPSQNLEDRPAMIDSARAPRVPRNSLMFTPEDLTYTHPHLQSVAQTAQERSKATPRAVSYANTRFGVTTSTALEEEESIPPSPTISAIDAAIRGGLKASHPSLAASTADGYDDDDGNQTPRVNGYSFIDAEPEPSELDATEYRTKDEEPSDPNDVLKQMLKARDDASGGADFGGNGSGHNPFNVRPFSRRENLHNAMVEKSLKAKRGPPKNSRLHDLQDGGDTASATGRTPTPRFASSPRVSSSIMERVAGGGAGAASTPNGGRTPVNLTPAGRNLYGRLGKEGGASGERDIGASGMFDTSSRVQKGGASWTPTPVRVKKVDR